MLLLVTHALVELARMYQSGSGQQDVEKHLDGDIQDGAGGSGGGVAGRKQMKGRIHMAWPSVVPTRQHVAAVRYGWRGRDEKAGGESLGQRLLATLVR